MRVHIPTIGEVWKLTRPWKFRLHAERRNGKAALKFGAPFKARDGQPFTGSEFLWETDYQTDELLNPPHPVKLPKGTTLRVNRIYIRQAMDDFDSVTFWGQLPGEVTFWGQLPGEKKKFRFWAKLEDVNKIYMEIVTDG